MRNDYYHLEVCNKGVCAPCDDIPATAARQWSYTYCGEIGDELVLTKKVPTQFQIIEIDIAGYKREFAIS